VSARTSLRFKLMASNILTKQVVILLAGVFLMSAFNKLMSQQAAAELDAVLDQLASRLAVDGGGAVILRGELADARFEKQHSGWYWQVTGKRAALNSASLGAAMIAPAAAVTADDPLLAFEADGPASQKLFVKSRNVELASADGGARSSQVTILAGRDKAVLTTLSESFRNSVIAALGGIAALLLTSAWFQMKIGLKSAEKLRRAIERIRLGEERRLADDFPDELQPLISEANRLLDSQDAAISKARSRAGDLAHGLKTPLTAVGMMAERLREAGEFDISRDIVEQIETASRHINRELARTRIAVEHRAGFKTDFEIVANRVIGTMEKLPRGDGIHWTLDAERGIDLAVEEADSIEILGNLLDNSRKWARSYVGLKAHARPGSIEIMVEDDGPGVAEDGHDQVLRRGVRLDESSPGSGLGLTIVKDIVEAYGGTIDLYRAGLGGLGVRLTLPCTVKSLH
jgi:signal transduction histidine kinase